ncbi:hypothetical protein ACFOYU_15460 [Microvirga sp. GCM10011540]|uniref:hypothetical protein n=1 Tax=Microvirga sp. GCM10011540 TaxID=3317338 RepID=UPI0036178C5B
MPIEKITSRLTSDQKLRELAGAFYTCADTARAKSADHATEIMRRGGWKLINENVYDLGPLKPIVSNLIKRCLELVGPEAINEREVYRLAWASVDIASPIPDQVANFLKELSSEIRAKVRILHPCYSVRVEEVREVQIGPVAVRLTDDVDRDLGPESGIRLTTEQPDGFQIIDGKSFVPLTPTCWDIELQSKIGNLEVEARWHTYVFTSLIRLIGYPQFTGPFSPNIGDVEAGPTEKPRSKQSSVTFYDTRSSFGGSWVPLHYVVGSAFVEHMKGKPYYSKLSILFNPPPNSVAERLQRGLGWMARGRISDDDTERLLFFFTAAEALLSDNDKSAPVVQNIARRGAVILSNDVTRRIEIAKLIQDLYAMRSDSVHRGTRRVHGYHARQVQNIVEAIHEAVLDKYDINKPSGDFHATLSRASFGLPWPEQVDIMPPGP